MGEIRATVETTRALYRPEQITTLFVGESPPNNGGFFYYGNNAMQSHMQRAVEDALGADGDFLTRFKRYGWYLDDLVLAPVDHLPKPLRKQKCAAARDDLARRIEKYRPGAIVSLLLSIQDIVDDAATAAHSEARCFAVPFPGMGHQVRFRAAMDRIVPSLPRLPT